MREPHTPVSLSVFSLGPDLCLTARAYLNTQKKQTVLQSSHTGKPSYMRELKANLQGGRLKETDGLMQSFCTRRIHLNV